MTIGEPLPDLSPALTPEQLALFHAEPEVPHLAVEAVRRALGAGIGPEDALLRAAVQGATEAARSYPSGATVSYRQWSLFHATYRVYEHLRQAHWGDRPVLARTRAAMMDFLAHHQQVLDPFHDNWDRNVNRLQAFTNGLLAAAAAGIAQSAQRGSRGEEDVLELEVARRTAEALKNAMAKLSPEDADLLRRRFVAGQSVRAIAEARGEKYWTLIAHYHDVLARLRVKLTAQGVQPVWMDGVSGEVFGASAANDGGEGE